MVFISYSSKDADAANAVRMVLQQNGIDCWMAPESIVMGDDYSSAIPKAIEVCDLFLLILSANSQGSKWVPKELDSAISHNKPIIPFQIDSESLTTSFNFMLSNIQRIEAFHDVEASYSKLLAHIKIELNTGNHEIEEAVFNDDEKNNDYLLIEGCLSCTTKWKLIDDNSTIVISGSGATPDFYRPEPDTPWKPFKYNIKKVIFEDGITEVGMQSFYQYPNIEEVIIPESVTDIRPSVFEGCHKLKNVKICKEVFTIIPYTDRKHAPSNSIVLWSNAFYDSMGKKE